MVKASRRTLPERSVKRSPLIARRASNGIHVVGREAFRTGTDIGALRFRVGYQ